MKKRIILSAVLSLAALANSFACTNLIVGKNASTDGSTTSTGCWGCPRRTGCSISGWTRRSASS